MSVSKSLLFFFLVAISFTGTLDAQIPMKDKTVESLKKMFGDSISVVQKKIILSSDEKAKVFQQSKTQWKSDTVEVYICTAKDKLLGCGFVDDVKGKVQFITYLVGITPAGEVKDVDVLAYRESYGGEVTYESFRKQFKGKTANDPVIPGKDIKNISGATISVRAITLGVKRVLATYELVKGRLQ